MNTSTVRCFLSPKRRQRRGEITNNNKNKNKNKILKMYDVYI